MVSKKKSHLIIQMGLLHSYSSSPYSLNTARDITIF